MVPDSPDTSRRVALVTAHLDGILDIGPDGRPASTARELDDLLRRDPAAAELLARLAKLETALAEILPDLAHTQALHHAGTADAPAAATSTPASAGAGLTADGKVAGGADSLLGFDATMVALGRLAGEMGTSSATTAATTKAAAAAEAKPAASGKTATGTTGTGTTATGTTRTAATGTDTRGLQLAPRGTGRAEVGLPSSDTGPSVRATPGRGARRVTGTPPPAGAPAPASTARPRFRPAVLVAAAMAAAVLMGAGVAVFLKFAGGPAGLPVTKPGDGPDGLGPLVKSPTTSPTDTRIGKSGLPGSGRGIEPVPPLPVARTGHRLASGALMMAGRLVGAAGGAAASPQRPAVMPGVLLEPAGAEPVVLQLADGTDATLEPGAGAILREGRPGSRLVFEVADGEAAFRVTRGAAPFRVDTPAGRVTVLGTEFRIAVDEVSGLWGDAGAGGFGSEPAGRPGGAVRPPAGPDAKGGAKVAAKGAGVRKDVKSDKQGGTSVHDDKPVGVAVPDDRQGGAIARKKDAEMNHDNGVRAGGTRTGATGRTAMMLSVVVTAGLVQVESGGRTRVMAAGESAVFFDEGGDRPAAPIRPFAPVEGRPVERPADRPEGRPVERPVGRDGEGRPGVGRGDEIARGAKPAVVMLPLGKDVPDDIPDRVRQKYDGRLTVNVLGEPRMLVLRGEERLVRAAVVELMPKADGVRLRRGDDEGDDHAGREGAEGADQTVEVVRLATVTPERAAAVLRELGHEGVEVSRRDRARSVILEGKADAVRRAAEVLDQLDGRWHPMVRRLQAIRRADGDRPFGEGPRGRDGENARGGDGENARPDGEKPRDGAAVRGRDGDKPKADGERPRDGAAVRGRDGDDGRGREGDKPRPEGDKPRDGERPRADGEKPRPPVRAADIPAEGADVVGELTASLEGGALLKVETAALDARGKLVIRAVKVGPQTELPDGAPVVGRMVRVWFVAGSTDTAARISMVGGGR